MKRLSGVQRLSVPVLFAFVIGIVLAMTAFKLLRYMELQTERAKFQLDAQDRINLIKREIETNLEAVQSIHSFYEGSEFVTRAEFRKFTTHLISRHPSIRAVEWIPRVPLLERERFEEETRALFPDFRITEWDEQHLFVNARTRNEYFPVYFVEPRRGNEAVMGFDVSSEPARRDALNHSRDSGAMAATARITLFREQDEPSAFLVFIPIYERNTPLDTIEHRRSSLIGFVAGVFKIEDIVETALSYLKPTGINMHLYDLSAQQKEVLLYCHQTRLADSGNESVLSELEDREDFLVETEFQLADRTWKISAVPVAEYLRDINDYHAWAASGGVLLIALVTVFYLKKVSDQTVRAENLIKKLGNEIKFRQEVEAALVSSEKEFRSLFENLNEAFAYHKMIYDEKNRPVDYEFITVNDAFEKTTGLKKETIAGRRITELIPGIKDLKPDLIALYGDIAQTGAEKKFEIFFRPLDKWFIISAYSPGKDHFVTVFSDITERKKFELERERLLSELSSKNRELEQILYVTSHDLRSPLVNVEGFGRELQYSMQQLTDALAPVAMPSSTDETVQQILKEDVPESMTYISKSIAKMDLMLKGLLKLSRLGRYETRMEEIDMNALLQDVIGNFEFKLKSMDITVHLSEVPPCRGDIEKINQVFSNLIDNAIKYLGRDRPGVITVSGKREGFKLVYCVEDNGIGIDSKYLEKIFKLFQQLNPGEGKGDGLGLTIARRIVELHHGRIWAESDPGKGSRFYVELPK